MAGVNFGKISAGIKGGLSGGAGLGDSSKKLEDDGNGRKDRVGGERFHMGYRHGGKVRRTGVAKLHKGERVLTRKQAKKYEKK